MNNAFGLYLSDMRSAAGLSMRAAAKKLGVSPGYLSRIEHGKERPGAPLVAAAVRVLGLDSDRAHRHAGRIPEDVQRLLMCPGAFDLVRSQAGRNP